LLNNKKGKSELEVFQKLGGLPHGTIVGFSRIHQTEHIMEVTVVLFFTFIVIFSFVLIMLMNNRIGHKISLDGTNLTIWHPLKKDEINLENDLKSWKLTRINRLWRGTIYALNLQTQSGGWKRLYFRHVDGKVRELLSYLEQNASGRQAAG
jgi:hypothetical protein